MHVQANVFARIYVEAQPIEFDSLNGRDAGMLHAHGRPGRRLAKVIDLVVEGNQLVFKGVVNGVEEVIDPSSIQLNNLLRCEVRLQLCNVAPALGPIGELRAAAERQLQTVWLTLDPYATDSSTHQSTQPIKREASGVITIDFQIRCPLCTPSTVQVVLKITPDSSGGAKAAIDSIGGDEDKDGARSEFTDPATYDLELNQPKSACFKILPSHSSTVRYVPTGLFGAMGLLTENGVRYNRSDYKCFTDTTGTGIQRAARLVARLCSIGDPVGDPLDPANLQPRIGIQWRLPLVNLSDVDRDWLPATPFDSKVDRFPTLITCTPTLERDAEGEHPSWIVRLPVPARMSRLISSYWRSSVVETLLRGLRSIDAQTSITATPLFYDVTVEDSQPSLLAFLLRYRVEERATAFQEPDLNRPNPWDAPSAETITKRDFPLKATKQEVKPGASWIVSEPVLSVRDGQRINVTAQLNGLLDPDGAPLSVTGDLLPATAAADGSATRDPLQTLWPPIGPGDDRLGRKQASSVFGGAATMFGGFALSFKRNTSSATGLASDPPVNPTIRIEALALRLQLQRAARVLDRFFVQLVPHADWNGISRDDPDKSKDVSDATSDRLPLADFQLTLPVDQGGPGGQDRPEDGVAGRAADADSLVLPLQSRETPSLIVFKEWSNERRSRAIEAKWLLDKLPNTAADTNDSNDTNPNTFRAIVLSSAPALVAQVIETPTPDESATTNEIGTWTGGNGGRGWSLRRSSKFTVCLPPQAMGEATVRGRDLFPGYPGFEFLDKPTFGNTSATAFSPATELSLASTLLTRDTGTPVWNLGKIFGRPGEEAPGAPCESASFEILYGLWTVVTASNLRLAELQSRIGSPVDAARFPEAIRRFAPKQQPKLDEIRKLDEQYMARWRRIADASRRRPSTLELWRASESARSTLRAPEVAFSLRLTDDTAGTPTRARMRNPTTPDSPFDLPGGAVWGIESRNVYEELLKNPVATDGGLSRLQFTPFGGTGDTEALFANRKQKIAARVSVGRVETYVLERIGRIGVLWNRAKHVIVYERAVAPSQQFKQEPDAPTAYPGVPIPRKVHEYIEILEPQRRYPEFGASPRVRGFIRGVKFKSLIIPVNPDNRREVDKGYVIPLWSTTDQAENPTVFPRPLIEFEADAGGQTGSGTVLREIADPDKLVFYTTTDPLLDDRTDAWPARLGIDHPDAFDPDRDEAPDAPTATGLERPLPDAPEQSAGWDQFTYTLLADGPGVNLVAERTSEPMLAFLRNVSMARGSTKPIAGDAAAALNNALRTIDRRAAAIAAGVPAEIEQAKQALERLRARGEPALAEANAILDKLRALDVKAIDTTLFVKDIDARLGAELQDRVTKTKTRVSGAVGIWQSQASAWFRELAQRADALVTLTDDLKQRVIDTTTPNADLEAIAAGMTQLAERLQSNFETLLRRGDLALPPTGFDEHFRNLIAAIKLVDSSIDRFRQRIEKPTAKRVEQPRAAVAGPWRAALDKLRELQAVLEAGNAQAIRNALLTATATTDRLSRELREQCFAPLELILTRFEGSLLDLATILRNARAAAADLEVKLRTLSDRLAREAKMPVVKGQELWDAIKAILDSILVKEADSVLDEKAVSILERLDTELGKAKDAITNRVKDIINARENLENNLLGAIESGGTFDRKILILSTWIEKLPDLDIADKLNAAARKLREGATNAQDEAAKALEEASKSLAKLVDEASKAKTAIEGLAANINNWATEAGELLKREIEELQKTLQTNLNSAVKQAIEQALSKLPNLDNLDQTIDDARAKLSEASAALTDLHSRAFSAANRVREGAQALADVGKGALTELAESFQQELRLVRAMGDAPIAPGLELTRKRLAYYFDRTEDMVGTSPVTSLLARTGEALKPLGVSFPTRALRDRFLPPDFKLPKIPGLPDLPDLPNLPKPPDLDALLNQLDLSKVLPDFGGLKLDGLFRGLNSGKLGEAVKVSHGIDRQSARAWVRAEVNHVIPSATVFEFSPIALRAKNIVLRATSRVEVGIDGATTQRSSGRLSADWSLEAGGTPIVTFVDAAIEFGEDGKLRFDIDPSRVRLPGVLKFITELLKKFSSNKNGLSIRPLLVGGVPMGVEAALAMDLPPIGAGTTGISNLAFSAKFGLMVKPTGRGVDFSLMVGFGLSSRESPFTIAIFLLGGAGYIEASATYAPLTRRVSAAVSIGVFAFASIAFGIGPIRGSVYAYLGIELDFSTGGGGGSAISLRAVLRLGGRVQVLGFICISIEVSLTLTFGEAGGQKYLIAEGRLKLFIKIGWLFRLSINVGVTFRFEQGRSSTQTDRDTTTNYLNTAE